nr:hypothetical protein Iba_chr15cCG7220 [Ipomoea batatas]
MKAINSCLSEHSEIDSMVYNTGISATIDTQHFLIPGLSLILMAMSVNMRPQKVPWDGHGHPPGRDLDREVWNPHRAPSGHGRPLGWGK